MIDYEAIQEAFEHQKDLMTSGTGHHGTYARAYPLYVANMGIDHSGLVRWSVEYVDQNLPKGPPRELAIAAFTRGFTLGVVLGREDHP